MRTMQSSVIQYGNSAHTAYKAVSESHLDIWNVAPAILFARTIGL